MTQRYFIERHYSAGVLMEPSYWDLDRRTLSKEIADIAAAEPTWYAPLGAGTNGRYLGSFETLAQLRNIDPTGLPRGTWVSVQHPHALGAEIRTTGRKFAWEPGDQRAEGPTTADGLPIIVAPSGAGALLGRWVWNG